MINLTNAKQSIVDTVSTLKAFDAYLQNVSLLQNVDTIQSVFYDFWNIVHLNNIA